MPHRPHNFLFYLLPSLFLAFAGIATATAQKAEEEDVFIGEWVFGVNANTNGGMIGGVMAKRSTIYDDKYSHFLQLEIVEVKHPKEWRYINEATQSTFVLGKSNYLFVLRPEFGIERTLFKKAPDQGIHVNLIGAAGPSVGILKPYLIYYDYSGGPQTDVRIEQYSPQQHRDPNDILGNAGFATNFSDSKVKPGFHIRTGVSFEYGQFRDNVAGIEVGFMYEQYMKELILVPEARNHSSYRSAYITLYFGWRR
jgi:hypothetical protein